MSVKKEKKAKQIQKKKKPASNTGNKMGGQKREASIQLDTDIELKRQNRAPSPRPSPEYEVDESPNEISEGRNYTKDY